MAQRPHSTETVYVRDVAAEDKPIVTASPLTGRTYEITPPGKAAPSRPEPEMPRGEAPVQETLDMPAEPAQQTM